MGSPQVYVRFIAIRDESEVEKGKWVAVIYTLLTDTAAVCIGLLGRYMLTRSGDNPELILGTAGEDVLALVLGQVMPTIIIAVSYTHLTLATICSV